MSLTRRVFVAVSAIGVFGGAPAMTPVAHAYEWSSGDGAITCTGGETNGQTIAEVLQSQDSAALDSLPPETVEMLQHVYVGTTCAGSAVSFMPLPALNAAAAGPVGGTLRGSVETVPFGSCPAPYNEGTASNPGCITAYLSWEVDFNVFSFFYRVLVQQEADIYFSPANWNWSPKATAFTSDTCGDLGGMAIGSYGPVNYGTHRGFGTTANGAASCFYGNAAFFVTLSNFATEDVHFAYQATGTISADGYLPATRDYCYFTDFHANNAIATNYGICASP